MVGSSKILTVSYGTFSCTLEGFDDAFETMKEIAEYFRGLAADDRHFGAEPPIPDVEMLARIAGRGIAHRVDAHEKDGRIVLRAAPAAGPGRAGIGETDTPAAEGDRGEAAEDDAEGPHAQAWPGESQWWATDVPQRPGTRGDTPFATARPLVEPLIGQETQDSVAAKLRRIRSVVTRSPQPFIDAEYCEDEHAQSLIDAFRDDAPTTRTAASETAAAATPRPEAAAEAEAEAPPTAAPDGSDTARVADANTNTDAGGTGAAPSATGAAQDGGTGAREAAGDRTPGAPATPPDEDASAGDAAEGGALEHPVAAPDDAATAGDASQDEPGPASPPAGRLDSAATGAAGPAPGSADSLAEGDAEGAEVSLETGDAPRRVDHDAVVQDTLAQLLADATPRDTVAPRPDSPGAAPHDAPGARVLKVKRSDLDQAVEQGLVAATGHVPCGQDADAGAERPAAASATADHRSLGAAHAADLQRDPGEAGAERGAAPHATAADTDTDDGAAAPEALAEMAPEVPAETAPDTPAGTAPGAGSTGRRNLEAAASRDNLSRYFDEAESQSANPEASQRRNAIQHLRAAVAATRAARGAGTEEARGTDETPYRADLATVVRPRRPRVGEGARHARPDDSRPAPLRLVAEQRVDIPRDPVRPRRVTAAERMAGVAQDRVDDSGFNDFAAQMGARQLPDLMEAAAAYLADVEGLAQFSRPMLMSKLKEATPGDFTREDGLRSFGKLLRQGKLQKLQGGRFAVTDTTDFRQTGARHVC